MVLSATQKTAFMEDGAHMGIPHDTVSQLQKKGIIVVPDLVDFDKYKIEKIDDNIHFPEERIDDTNPGAAPGAKNPAPPLVFESKS